MGDRIEDELLLVPYDYANANENAAVARRSFPPQQQIQVHQQQQQAQVAKSFTTQNMGSKCLITTRNRLRRTLKQFDQFEV